MTISEAIEILEKIQVRGKPDEVKAMTEATQIAIECMEIEESCQIKLERPFGKWILDKNVFNRCSICNTYSCYRGNYCQNCGARMVDPQESEDNKYTKEQT